MPEDEDSTGRDIRELLHGRDHSARMVESGEDAVDTAKVYSRCHQMDLRML